MPKDSRSFNVIRLSDSSVHNLLEFASHWMVTGFIEDGRVLGRKPSDAFSQPFYIRYK